MPKDYEVFQPMQNLRGEPSVALLDEVAQLRKENELLLQHCRSHQRDYKSLASKLDAADRASADLAWAIDNVYTIARRELRRLERAGSSEVESVSGDRWGHVLRLCEQTGAQSRAVGVLRSDDAVDPHVAK